MRCRSGERVQLGGKRRASRRHSTGERTSLAQASAPVWTRSTIPHVLVRRRGDRRIVITCERVGMHPVRVAGPARERGLVHFSGRVRS